MTKNNTCNSHSLTLQSKIAGTVIKVFKNIFGICLVAKTNQWSFKDLYILTELFKNIYNRQQLVDQCVTHYHAELAMQNWSSNNRNKLVLCVHTELAMS